MRNPTKIRYIKTKNHGAFEVPMKANKNKNIDQLAENFRKAEEFSEFLCPKGLKPTITSRHKKPREEHEFVNQTMTLARSPKPYNSQTVCFRANDMLSSREINQYLSKLYKIPITQIHTFRKQGVIQTNRDNNTKWRKPDYKKAIV